MDDLAKDNSTQQADTPKRDVYEELSVGEQCVGSISDIIHHDEFYNEIGCRMGSDDDFREKILKTLKSNNIDILSGGMYQGEQSILFEIGENQLLHISSASSSIKPNIKYNAPEIIQPLVEIYKDEDIKVEILPKVINSKDYDIEVTDEEKLSLMTSLAKKGLFFTDAHGGNVGFVEVNGEMIPLVIGDGSVVSSKDLTKPSYFEYDEPENEYEKPTNLEVFVDLYRHLQLGTNIGIFNLVQN